MKVMHLISGGDTGGAKTHVLTLIRTLSSAIDVHLVCLTDGPFYREALEMGLPVTLSEQRSRTDLSALRRLRDLVSELDPNLVHCHGARANFLGALLRRRTTVPLVTTIHSDYRRDFEANLYKHLVYSTLNSLSLRSFDHYLAVTEDFRSMLIDRGFPGGRVHTVYNGLDFSVLPDTGDSKEPSLREELGIPGDAIVVGMVGRMARIKRHDVLLEAGAKLIGDGAPVHILLVGDGEENQNLRRQADARGITERVHFTGHLASPESAFAAMDINVLPSESESFPYALLEGALHGLATVATPVGGIPELVRHERTGLTARVGDHLDLSKKIEQLVADPPMRARLGESLRRHAAKNFSEDSMRDDHLRIYRSVIAAGRMPPRVTVSGYFGFGNTGDEALLRGLIGGLRRERPGVDIWVLSGNHRATAKTHRVSSAPRFSPISVISCLKRCGLFISGGGTLLQDETSLRSLFYYTSLIYAARVLRTPVMLYANGIGPLHTGIGRCLARGALSSASGVTLRDRASAGTVRAITREGTVQWEVTADPAFALEDPESDRVDEILAESGVLYSDSNPLAIISMRPWGGDMQLPANLAARAADILSDEGFSPLLLAMQESRDLPLARLASEMSRSKPPVIGTSTVEPELVMGMMGRAKMVLGMRLHALIMAAAAGSIPVGVSYDPKIDGFLSDLGAPCLGRMENLTPDRLEEILIESIIPRLDELASVVDDGAKIMKKKEEGNAQRAISLLE